MESRNINALRFDISRYQECGHSPVISNANDSTSSNHRGNLSCQNSLKQPHSDKNPFLVSLRGRIVEIETAKNIDKSTIQELFNLIMSQEGLSIQDRQNACKLVEEFQEKHLSKAKRELSSTASTNSFPENPKSSIVRLYPVSREGLSLLFPPREVGGDPFHSAEKIASFSETAISRSISYEHVENCSPTRTSFQSPTIRRVDS